MAPSPNPAAPAPPRPHSRSVMVAGGVDNSHSAVCDFPDCLQPFPSRNTHAAAAQDARAHRLEVKQNYSVAPIGG